MILSTMVRSAGLLILLTAVTASAEVRAPVIVGDAFDGGKRNSQLWSIPSWSDARFRINSGRLLFSSHPTNSSSHQTAGWVSTFRRKLTEGDILNVTAQARVPRRLAKSDPDACYDVGLGIFASTENMNCIELTVSETVSNRQFVVYYLTETPDVDWMSWTFPAPAGMNNFLLNIRYTAANDRIHFFWADPKIQKWNKIGAMSMKELFGTDKPRRMTPYVVGNTENTVVKPDWNVWVDNFRTVYRKRPLP
jgi:hypothetical protein